MDGGALQFREFTLINNELAGFEGKLLVGEPPQYDELNGPGIFDSLIVASYTGLKGKPTSRAIVLPYYQGFLVKNVTFVNFKATVSMFLL